jgi:hypothetical protein
MFLYLIILVWLHFSGFVMAYIRVSVFHVQHLVFLLFFSRKHVVQYACTVAARSLFSSEQLRVSSTHPQ